jgi:tRNA(His) 5'-end guanylyltransferase
MTQDSLGDRMKNYENVSRNYLTRRMPVIIRLDGKAFHTLTRGMDKPFDTKFIECMLGTTYALFKEVQNCKLAYTQSDEISLLLVDYNELDTQPWFDNNIQKMVSVAASLATHVFNHSFAGDFPERAAQDQFGLFDARAFNVPREDVDNYFVWRQKDCIRNSIQAVGQANFTQKQLQGKSCDVIKEMLLDEGFNWDELPVKLQRGTVFTKSKYSGLTAPSNPTPLFSENREIIEKLVFPERYKEELVINLPVFGHQE